MGYHIPPWLTNTERDQPPRPMLNKKSMSGSKKFWIAVGITAWLWGWYFTIINFDEFNADPHLSKWVIYEMFIMAHVVALAVIFLLNLEDIIKPINKFLDKHL